VFSSGTTGFQLELSPVTVIWAALEGYNSEWQDLCLSYQERLKFIKDLRTMSATPFRRVGNYEKVNNHTTDKSRYTSYLLLLETTAS
jgi:hypothetical protein